MRRNCAVSIENITRWGNISSAGLCSTSSYRARGSTHMDHIGNQEQVPTIDYARKMPGQTMSLRLRLTLELVLLGVLAVAVLSLYVTYTRSLTANPASELPTFLNIIAIVSCLIALLMLLVANTANVEARRFIWILTVTGAVAAILGFGGPSLYR